MKIVAFGEILFDVVNGEHKLGGAPFNFCAHSAKLGTKSAILSAVGNDEWGEVALDSARSFGVDIGLVKHTEYPTGMCIATVKDGEPSYDLDGDYAYDHIALSESELNSLDGDVFYFGTLAERSDESRGTLYRILDSCEFKTVFYDMNLRKSYYTRAMLEKNFFASDIVKVNRDELEYIKNENFVSGGGSEFFKAFCLKYRIGYLLVTLDSDGAMIYSLEADKVYRFAAEKQKVVSAIGAGDSFSACFLYNFMSGADIMKCLERACALGGYVVGFEGAIPEYDSKLKSRILPID